MYNLSATFCDLSMYKEAEQVQKRIDKLNSEENSGLPSLNLGRIADQHIMTARSYKKSGLKIEAIREYEKALSIYPDLYEAKIELSKLRIETGQYEQAKALLSKTMGSKSDDPEIYALYATAYIKQDKIDPAIDLLNKALHINPSHRLSRSLLAGISG